MTDLVATGTHTALTDQRRLRVLLRQYREAAGLTQSEVAASTEWSVSKIIRIESGVSLTQVTDVRILSAEYGIPRDAVAELAELARASRRREWWHGFGSDLRYSIRDLLAHEASAIQIRQYEACRIPGLLQSAQHQQHWPDLPLTTMPDGTGEAVRLRRQRILTASYGRRLRFVLDEAVLWRLHGDIDAHLGQLDRLLVLSEIGHVEIAVVPLRAGAHAGMVGGTARVFCFVPVNSGDHGLVCAMQHPGEEPRLTDDDAAVDRHVRTLDSVDRVAVDGDDARELIVNARTEIVGGRGYRKWPVTA